MKPFDSDLDLFVCSRSRHQLLAEPRWKGSLCGNVFPTRKKCQKAIVFRGRSLFGGAETESFSGAWVGGLSVASLFCSEQYFYLLALMSIFRKKLIHYCYAGSLGGETEMLLLDSLATQFSLMGC